jgi:hypothetical protein
MNISTVDKSPRTAQAITSDSPQLGNFTVHTVDGTSDRTGPPRTRVVRTTNIPPTWEEADLRECLNQVVEGLGRSFCIAAFHTSAADRRTKTALLTSSELSAEQWKSLDSSISRRNEIIPREHPGVRLFRDTACTGLTTIYEPLSPSDAKIEYVRIAHTST